MGRPKGSKNKPKKDKLDKILNEFQEELQQKETTTFNSLDKIVKVDDTQPIQEPQKAVEETLTTQTKKEKVVEEESGEKTEEDGFVDVNELEDVNPTPSRSSKKTKQIKQIEICKRCKSPLSETPFRIDTTAVTGMMGYWREHPQFVKLCRKCCLELSELVDNWLGDYPKKFTDFGVREEE